jgi:prepilin-type N-terminal cleavage/methylation domain-containing protein
MKQRDNKNINKGFTLIEVLIVVFIIGLLASVVLVGLGAFRARGRDARRVADLRSIQNALELYYGAANNQYPTGVNFAGMRAALLGANIGVSSVPQDPGNFQYQYGSNGQSYILGAQLEDENNPVLKDDVDGSASGATFNVECGAPTNDKYYCLRF